MKKKAAEKDPVKETGGTKTEQTGAAKGAVEQSAEITFPAKALIAKGADRIPVDVKDQTHLEQLVSAHGSGSVEVLK